ncbi:MAG: methyltransferase domain-containing protein [Kiritimatiellae bacterium]|nr:methyltransferase domain-containing protein [Kiritimatiellia bacterium]MDW8458352.1 methyltransferase domain-containing protein [Verrucomicrobiota bacterium]
MKTTALDRHQRARFSAAAPTYEDAALVQRQAADRLLERWPDSTPPTRVLDVGCGTGHLTRRIAEKWPGAIVIGIDHAPGMIEEARRRTDTHARILFVCEDAFRFRPDESFDAVLSSSTLHWLQPIDEACRAFAGYLRQAGRIGVSLMLSGTLRELKEARRAIAPDASPPADLPTEPSVEKALRSAGFHLDAIDVEEHVVLRPSIREIFDMLRKSGVTGGIFSRGDRPLNRRELIRVAEWYEQNYRDAEGVRATYRIGYYWGRLDI